MNKMLKFKFFIKKIVDNIDKFIAGILSPIIIQTFWLFKKNSFYHKSEHSTVFYINEKKYIRLVIFENHKYYPAIRLRNFLKIDY